jgi:hypothetical protein
VTGTVVDGTVVVEVVVVVVDEVVDTHSPKPNVRPVIVRLPGWQHESVEYCWNANTSPGSTSTSPDPVALFSFVSFVTTPLRMICGGSYQDPSFV